MIEVEAIPEPYIAYLDIETTGLNPARGEITVIGICLEHGHHQTVIQLLGDDISYAGLLKTIGNVHILYTYNGTRFDLPYIRTRLGIDLTEYCHHIDLMYECWRRKLYGGLKRVEKQLNIKRKLREIDGRMAVTLWYDYKFYGDQQAMDTLLEYNKEDVLNLKLIRERLQMGRTNFLVKIGVSKQSSDFKGIEEVCSPHMWG